MNLSGRRIGARLAAPLLTLLAVLGAAAAWRFLEAYAPLTMERPVGQVLTALACAVVIWLGLRLLDVIVWEGLRGPGPRRAPAIVIVLVDGIVWLVAAAIIAQLVFELPVTAVAATSGIAIAIVGFALRDTLASLTSGVAIGLERCYHLGDWIELGPGAAGRITEIGWLTTRVVTNEQVTLVIPNARLASTPFRNYGSPSSLTREQIEIPLDQTLSPARVERILLAAARSVPTIAGVGREPDVRIADFGAEGVRWLIRYWVADTAGVPDIRYALHRAVLRHLHQAGIVLPYRRLDMFHSPMPARVLTYEADLDRLLQRSELFATMPLDELRALAAKAVQRSVRAGEVVVRQGEPGRSLFIIVEGVLAALANTGNGAERVLRTLGPGAMFGEFALLTGEPRSATVRAQSDSVVFEIGRDDLEPILQRRPELATELGRILAERQATRASAADSPGDRLPPGHEREALLLDRIRAFFGL